MLPLQQRYMGPMPVPPTEPVPGLPKALTPAQIVAGLLVGAICIVIVCVIAARSGHAPAATPDPSTASAAPSATAAPLLDARAARVEKVRAWTPAQRAAWVKHCIGTPCKDDEVLDIVHAGADPDEVHALSLLGLVGSIRQEAQLATDGALSTPAIQGILDAYRGAPDVPMTLLEHTTRTAAMKEIDAHRGSFISVTGTVVQVQRDGQLFWSTLMDDTGAFSYLITPFDADGVEVHGWATFEGVVVQRYTYANAIGGGTESLAVVGQFKGKLRRLLK